MIPHQLYEWAQSSIHNLSFNFVTENECKEDGLLSSQFAATETVHGTQQLHAFMPVKKGVLNRKIYSASLNYAEECVISVLKEMIELKDITGFVTCMYDNFWWLGCALSVSEESNDIKISFLHPYGPSASYIYPATPHILWLPQSTILTKVSLNTATGCTYTLTSEETKLTAERSKNTSATSTNQDERTLHFSCKLSKENVFWPNALSLSSVYKIVLTIFISFYTSSFLTRMYLTI
jgi:hypothetical protein